LDIIHKPDNTIAINIYRSFGFELTDEALDDDVISRLILINEINSREII
jgi:hypothetical protein